MKSFLISIICLCFITGSCASKKLTPDIQRVVNINELVNAIGTLQNAAISLNLHNELSVPDATKVVKFCNDSLKLIQIRDANWQHVVLLALNDMPDSVSKKFSSSVELIKFIIGNLK